MAKAMKAEQRLRIMFLSHYFPPEVGAPQARMFELAKRLHDAGETVTVLTAFPNYPTGVVQEGYRGRFAMEERMDGLRVVRRWVFATPNAGVFKRIFNWLSFVTTSLTALRTVGPVDVIFVQSPPLPIGLAALAYSRLKRAPFVFNVSDIWPESAVQLGMLRGRFMVGMAEWLEMHLYRRAARVTVPTPGMLERLAARGVSRAKLVWLTNAVDTAVYRPEAADPELARRLGLDGRKIFLYAGTHGLSQGLDVILEAAKLTDDPDILYVLAGEGADKAALVAKARAEGIANVRFLPNQPKSSMPALLNLAYAGIVPLRPLDVFRNALPSKMFESMAVAQPIVAALWGEGAEMVRASACGLVTEPGDARQMRDAVVKLAADPQGAREMGRRGRAYVDEHYNRDRIAVRLHELLREVARATE
jgi:glycosyltransferase involved in cell wall biosynthesis